MTLIIRRTEAEDFDHVLALHKAAFPIEDLTRLVADLLALEAGASAFAAFEETALVGHAIFCGCGTSEGEMNGSLLGPLAVAPTHQRRGLGSALIRHGLNRLSSNGISQAFLLGDPAYYSKFGFGPERDVQPPFPLPEDWADAWQSRTLPGRTRLSSGRLHLPAPWTRPELWQP